METATLRVAALYAKVGPRLFPGLVAAGLILIGALLAREALRGGPGGSDAPPAQTQWGAFILVSAGLLLQALLIERLGFVLASTILFCFVAMAFGSRRHLRDAAIGVILSAVIFVGFTRGLDLSLPAGILEGLL